PASEPPPSFLCHGGGGVSLPRDEASREGQDPFRRGVASRGTGRSPTPIHSNRYFRKAGRAGRGTVSPAVPGLRGNRDGDRLSGPPALQPSRPAARPPPGGGAL